MHKVQPFRDSYIGKAYTAVDIFRFAMCHLNLQKKLGRRSLARRGLSLVLKLWHLEEAHIPPNISKIKMFEHFGKNESPKGFVIPYIPVPFHSWMVDTQQLGVPEKQFLHYG